MNSTVNSVNGWLEFKTLRYPNKSCLTNALLIKFLSCQCECKLWNPSIVARNLTWLPHNIDYKPKTPIGICCALKRFNWVHNYLLVTRCVLDIRTCVRTLIKQLSRNTCNDYRDLSNSVLVGPFKAIRIPV